MNKKLILAGVVVSALCLPQITACSDENAEEEQNLFQSDSTNVLTGDTTNTIGDSTGSIPNDTLSKLPADSIDSMQVIPAIPFVDTMTVSGEIANYSYVDLGLKSGLKWATYNIGATKTTEYGDYYAWGATESKRGSGTTGRGTVSNYIYELFINKYNSDSSYVIGDCCGIIDNKTVLEASDDAAVVNWGSSWRMPTKEEMNELIEGCTWQWVENYGGTGISGQMGKSKSNGNVIFLPASGYYYYRRCYSKLSFGWYETENLAEVGSSANYLTSSRYEDRSILAYSCQLDNSSVSISSVIRDEAGSWQGWGNYYSVRAVSR